MSLGMWRCGLDRAILYGNLRGSLCFGQQHASNLVKLLRKGDWGGDVGLAEVRAASLASERLASGSAEAVG